MILLLDTNILTKICHPTKFTDVRGWFHRQLLLGVHNRKIHLPAIADYELRRELLRMRLKDQGGARSLVRLNTLLGVLDYLPMTAEDFRLAAQLWAEARVSGRSTADPKSLDGDVLLAAQAKRIQGTVVTNNRKHVSLYGVEAKDWFEVEHA